MKRVFLITCALLLLIPAWIFAQQPPSSPVRPKPKTVLDFKEELGLKTPQLEKLKAIIDNFEKAAQPLREKIVSQNREIRQLLDKEADLSVVKPKLREVFSLQADLMVLELEAGRKIERELTPEQLNKWKAIRKKGGQQ